MDKQIQKKLKPYDYLKIKGKTYKEITDLLGNDYHPESNENTLIYIVNKTWFSKGQALLVEFDGVGRADTIIMLKNYNLKKNIPEHKIK